MRSLVRLFQRNVTGRDFGGIMDEQHTSFNIQVYLENASWGAALIPAVLLQTINTALHNIHVESASRGAALIPAVLLYSIHTNITNIKLIKSFSDSSAQLPRETLPRSSAPGELPAQPRNTPKGLGSPPISLPWLRETPYNLSGLPALWFQWVYSRLPRRAGVPNGLYSSVWR